MTLYSPQKYTTYPTVTGRLLSCSIRQIACTAAQGFLQH